MSKQGKPRKVTRTTVHMLTALEKEQGISQRNLAAEIGIALGATNAYIQKCIAQGWIQKQGSRSCKGYKLTPKGILKKSMLNARCLRNDLCAYKQIRKDVEAILTQQQEVYIYGTDTLAEIATTSALAIDGNTDRIKGYVDPNSTLSTFFGKPVIQDMDKLSKQTPLIFTSLHKPIPTYLAISKNIDTSLILVPQTLKQIISTRSE